MADRIYRILTADEWTGFRAAGRFAGGELDRRDGFIHLSAADQVAGSLAAYFAGRGNLVLLAIDAAALGTALRWEPSRGGALFPHLYGALPLAAVTGDYPLALAADGRHQLPSAFGVG